MAAKKKRKAPAKRMTEKQDDALDRKRGIKQTPAEERADRRKGVK